MAGAVMALKILRNKHVCERLGISPATLWRWIKAGKFPAPGKLQGTSYCGWQESVVDEWIEQHFGLEPEV